MIENIHCPRTCLICLNYKFKYLRSNSYVEDYNYVISYVKIYAKVLSLTAKVQQYCYMKRFPE